MKGTGIVLVAAIAANGIALSAAACAVREDAHWQEVGRLPIPLESHAMVAVGDIVYVIGGWNATGGAHAEVFYAPIAGGRIAGEWQQATASLPLRLQHHQVVVWGGSLYVIGGDNGFGPNGRVSDRIFRAVPTATGNITAWEAIGRLPEPRTIHGATIADDRLYILGGSATFRADTTLKDTAWVAEITPDGSLGEFTTLPPLPQPVGWLTATTSGNRSEERIVAIAGRTGFKPWTLTGTIWQATLEESQPTALEFAPVGTTTARERHATVRLGDNALAIIGGGTAREPLATVTATTVAPTGGLAPWVFLQPLPQIRYAHAALVHEENILVSGGFLRYGSNETSQQIFGLAVCEVQ